MNLYLTFTDPSKKSKVPWEVLSGQHGPVVSKRGERNVSGNACMENWHREHPSPQCLCASAVPGGAVRPKGGPLPKTR